MLYNLTDWSVRMATPTAKSSKRSESALEIRRSQLLDGARRIFSRKGFYAATVDEIAESAGVAKGTVYLYFRSKEELYFAVMQHDLDELYAATVARLAESSGAHEKIRAYIKVRFDFAESRQEFLKLLHSEAATLMSTNQPLAHLIRVTYPERTRLLLKGVLEQAITRGEMRRVPIDVAARLIYELTVALVHRRLTTEQLATADEELNTALDLLWHGLGAAG